MAYSTCVNCKGSTFETIVQSPQGTSHKIYFVQCSQCGGVVGILPYHNPSVQYDNIIAAIQAVAKELNLRIDWSKVIV